MGQLTFMMGEFEAEFPTDRRYAKNHMWCQQTDRGLVRFGFTAYSVRLLQDVYFLDWEIDAPSAVTAGQEIGSIESKKAESSLYCPAAGQLVGFNDDLMDDPSAINVDKYGDGWLFEIELQGGYEDVAMDAAAYVNLLEDVWEQTQRTIKGQVNQ